jgi:hypothetical protein
MSTPSAARLRRTGGDWKSSVRACSAIPDSSELAELPQAVLVRLMEQRQLSDPFGLLVYAELAGAELPDPMAVTDQVRFRSSPNQGPLTARSLDSVGARSLGIPGRSSPEHERLALIPRPSSPTEAIGEGYTGR